MPSAKTQAFILASRHGATRRRNLVNGGLVAGLVRALGLAGVALWQRSEAIAQRKAAEQQRQIAERNFAAAKATVDGLIFDISQGLGDVMGMRAETLRAILETSRKTVNGLLAPAPDDPRLLRSKLVMLNNFSRTYLAKGSIAEARWSAEDGLAVARKSAALNPGGAEVDNVLAIYLGRIGDIRLTAKPLRSSAGLRRRCVMSRSASTKWAR